MPKHLKLHSTDDIKLGKRTREVVEYAFDNPNLTYTELSKHFGISKARISQIMTHDKVIAAFPVLARRKLGSMVPKAMRRFGQLMEQNDNLEVSRKVVQGVLESKKVLDPEPKTQINIYQQMPVEELKRMVDDSKVIDIPLSDVEMVTDLASSLDNAPSGTKQFTPRNRHKHIQ